MPEGDRLRGVLVGFGRMGEARLAAYERSSAASLVAIVDPTPQRRAAARAVAPRLPVYSTMDEVGSGLCPDFIDICSPPRWHADNIVNGLEMGCHVMCEKPLVDAVAEYDRVLAAVESAPGVLFPCHNYKFSPVIRHMFRIVAGAGFGGVASGHFSTLRTGHAMGAPDWRPDWRRERAVAGGGILLDHGTHSVYLATHLTNLEPESVSCVTSSRRGSAFATTEDTAMLAMQLPNGVRFTIELTWAAESRRTSFSIVGGSEAVHVIDDRLVHVASSQTTERDVSSGMDDPAHRGWFHDMFDDFRALVQDPSRQHELLLEAYRTALVIECAYESARRGGEPVSVPPRYACGNFAVE